MLATAAPAQVHASLVSATPVDGARVDTAPTEVDFHFDQTVRLADDATQVTADSGQRVDLPARTVHSGTTVVVPLSPAIPTGAYTAS